MRPHPNLSPPLRKGDNSYYLSSGLQNTIKHCGFETLYCVFLYTINCLMRLSNGSPQPLESCGLTKSQASPSPIQTTPGTLVIEKRYLVALGPVACHVRVPDQGARKFRSKDKKNLDFMEFIGFTCINKCFSLKTYEIHCFAMVKT